MKKLFFIIMVLSLGAFFTGCASTRPQFGQAWQPAQARVAQNTGLAERLIAKFGSNTKSTQAVQSPMSATKTASPDEVVDTKVSQPTTIEGEKNKVPAVKKSSVHKKHQTKTRSNLERRVAHLESRVNRNQDRVSLLEDRFNRSPSENIKADKILFYSGSTKLRQAGKKYFDTLAEKFKKGTVRNIVVTGYASKAGKKGDNFSLSQKRALVAQTYLKTKGVDVQAVGAGETDRYTINTNIIITYEEKR